MAFLVRQLVVAFLYFRARERSNYEMFRRNISNLFRIGESKNHFNMARGSFI